VEAEFEVKLGRARRKEQYLRIQASYLAQSSPNVALMLLDRYFALPDQRDQAQAHVDCATAYNALGRLEDAVGSYESALAYEARFPFMRTSAYIELPTFIAEHGLSHHYERALAVLSEHRDRVAFHSDTFKWHASSALILSARGQSAVAREHARNALEASTQGDSGFRYHPTVGLVTERHAPLLTRLRGLCDA
jgi:tetratricopeptide (TPR) repeat protein